MAAHGCHGLRDALSLESPEWSASLDAAPAEASDPSGLEAEAPPEDLNAPVLPVASGTPGAACRAASSPGVSHIRHVSEGIG